MEADLNNMKRLAVCLGLLFLALALSACAPENQCYLKGGPTLHVLFIGNSYTFVNDLPGMFSKLACSGGKKVETDSYAQGGWTLAQHAASADSLAKINQQKWDFVVLQEQSEVPAIYNSRIQTMYPAARTLVSLIKQKGAQPLFFLTWGHRDGDPQFGLANYNVMQSELNIGYTGIALELGVPVAPVGKAWQKIVTQPNAISLWQDDASHPTVAGTYLAASVFYAAIFKEKPLGLTYYAGLSQPDAQTLQKTAGETALPN
jgi:hypothetical protein